MAKETIVESFYLRNYTPTGRFFGKEVEAVHNETGKRVAVSEPFAGGCGKACRTVRPIEEEILAAG